MSGIIHLEVRASLPVLYATHSLLKDTVTLSCSFNVSVIIYTAAVPVPSYVGRVVKRGRGQVEFGPTV